MAQIKAHALTPPPVVKGLVSRTPSVLDLLDHIQYMSSTNRYTFLSNLRDVLREGWVKRETVWGSQDSETKAWEAAMLVVESRMAEEPI